MPSGISLKAPIRYPHANISHPCDWRKPVRRAFESLGARYVTASRLTRPWRQATEVRLLSAAILRCGAWWIDRRGDLVPDLDLVTVGIPKEESAGGRRVINERGAGSGGAPRRGPNNTFDTALVILCIPDPAVCSAELNPNMRFPVNERRASSVYLVGGGGLHMFRAFGQGIRGYGGCC